MDIQPARWSSYFYLSTWWIIAILWCISTMCVHTFSYTTHADTWTKTFNKICPHKPTPMHILHPPSQHFFHTCTPSTNNMPVLSTQIRSRDGLSGVQWWICHWIAGRESLWTERAIGQRTSWVTCQKTGAVLNGWKLQISETLSQETILGESTVAKGFRQCFHSLRAFRKKQLREKLLLPLYHLLCCSAIWQLLNQTEEHLWDIEDIASSH